jgi:Divergent InlB B-repeat domain
MSSPAGISCPGACKKAFAAPVRLTAKPSPGWKFTGWRGVCTGKRPCVLSATASVRAVFARR